MSISPVTIALVDGKTISQTIELKPAGLGKAMRIKAVEGGHYILAEGAQGIAPANITVKRVGKDLYVTLEGSDPSQPELIIEGFFDTAGQLIGMAADGSYYPYIASDGLQEHMLAFLMDDVSALQMLGSESLSGFAAGLGTAGSWLTPALAGLGGVGLLGAGLAIANSGGGGGHKSAATVDVARHAVLDSVGDNVGDSQGVIRFAGNTDDINPTFTGTGIPGSTVDIADNDKVIGAAVVGCDGHWVFTPIEPLALGPHEITVFEINPDSTFGPESPPFQFFEGPGIPGKPANTPGGGGIQAVVDNLGTVTGPIANDGVGSTDDTTPTLAGSGIATDETVTVYANGVPVPGLVIYDLVAGSWTFEPSPALAAGVYSFTVALTNAAGTGPQSDSFIVALDTAPPGTPLNSTDGGGIEAIDDNFGAVTGPIANDGFGSTDDTTPTLHGSGIKANETVTVYADGVEVPGTVIYDRTNGNWTFDPNPALAAGVYSFTVALTNAAGMGPQSDPHIVTLDTSPPGVPLNTAGGGGIEGIDDNVGPVTGAIAKDGFGYTDDTTPTLHGSGIKANESVTVYADGVEVPGTVIYDRANGSWSFDPNPALTTGVYSFTVALTNAAGTGPQSAAQIVTLDTSTPAIPVPGAGGIEQIIDNVEAITGLIPNDGVGLTNDSIPALTGTGLKAGETVKVYEGGVLLAGTVTYGPAVGSWSFEPTVALASGAHVLTTSLTNGAGVEGPQSAGQTVTIDLVPSAVTLDAVNNDNQVPSVLITNGGATNDNTPLVSGTGENGNVITVYATNSLGVRVALAPVTVVGGVWSVNSAALADGIYTFEAVASDGANHTSAATTWSIRIDTVNPLAVLPATMGKDSGTSSTDFLTNDGRTERLIQGTLSAAAVAAGESVQISTDGGTTWVNAIISGTSWSALDPAAHSSNWSILTRVVDLGGNTTTSSRAVTLDTVAPSQPLSFTVSGQNVVVKFSDAALVAGDLVDVISGTSRFQHTLTQAEVTAQSASFSLPVGMPAPTGVAVVDLAGNSSSAISFTTAVYSFDGLFANGTAIPGVFTFSGPQGGLTIDSVGNNASIETSGSFYGATGQSLNFATLNVPGTTISGTFAEAKSISLVWGASDDPGGYIEYFGTGGSLGTQPIPGNGTFTSLSFTAPEGTFINSFVVVLPNGEVGAALIDTVNLTGIKVSTAPAQIQTIQPTSDAEYFGGSNDNTFNLSNIVYFNGANSGIHGNAGMDTLALTGTNQILDLTTLLDKLHSVESINLTGTGNNTLKLSIEDVLEQGGAGLFDNINSDVQMLVKGNVGDVVNLEDQLHNGTDPGDWVHAASPVVVAGVTYEVYHYSTLDAELLVQQGVTTNLV